MSGRTFVVFLPLLRLLIAAEMLQIFRCMLHFLHSFIHSFFIIAQLTVLEQL